MSIIYEPHVCPTPQANSARPHRVTLYEAGTIWRCDDCGTYWRFREQFTHFLGEWRRVRFWNLLALHRIRKATH